MEDTRVSVWLKGSRGCMPSSWREKRLATASGEATMIWPISAAVKSYTMMSNRQEASVGERDARAACTARLSAI